MATENGSLGPSDLQVQPDGPLLDNGHQNCTATYCHECRKARSKEKRRRGKTYQRAQTGLRRWGQQWQMWTLTSSWEAMESRDIRTSFHALKERLRRAGFLCGYFKVTEFTRRGWPHIHMILAGPPVPFWWMAQAWDEIHLSYVWFSKMRTQGRAAGYVAKYMGKDPRARYSWGWTWAWKGFAKDWRQLVSDGLNGGAKMVDIIEMWGDIVDAFRRRSTPLARDGAPIIGF